MVISGLIKSSFIDYPGKIAAVIFTQGCNFRCGFCHNPGLISMSNKELEINVDDIVEFLKKRRGKLDGVVITGGEPTIQGGLTNFIKKVRTLGYAVKLDTNGSNPILLKKMILDKLVDYIAMDIKNLPGKYKKTCGYSNFKNIKKSISIIKKSGIDYEFRTTVLPAYHKLSDFEEIGKLIKGSKRYVIQGFRDEVVFDKKLIGAKKFSQKDLEKIKKILNNYVTKVLIRGNL